MIQLVQPGDYFVVATHGFVGACIRFGTRSRFNHAGLILDQTGRTIEAKPHGTCYGHLSTYTEDTFVIYRPPLDPEQREAVVNFAPHLIGARYGFLDVAALGLMQFGVRLPFVKHRVENPTYLFCSEEVDYIYCTIGFHLFNDNRTPLDVTPGDLDLLGSVNGWHVGGHNAQSRGGF